MTQPGSLWRRIRAAMPGGKRIAILSTSLQRGGSERYAVELTQTFLRRGWQVDVLCNSRSGGEQHFAPVLREAGAQVLPVISWPGHRGMPPGTVRLPALTAAAKKARAREAKEQHVEAWARFLRRYPAVLVMQIENYENLQGALDGHPAVSVHLVSHNYQYDHDIYAFVPPDSRIRVIAQDHEQLAEFVDSTGGLPQQQVIPLGFDFAPFEPIDGVGSRVSPDRPVRVGVFIRISRQRPIGPLFEALAQINAVRPCELYHYGGYGDPSDFEPQLDALGIRDRVVFRGPTDDFRASVVDDELDYAWMTSIGESVGYATLELAALGVPVMFWSESDRTAEDVAKATGGAVLALNRVADLTEAHLRLTADPEVLTALGADLRRFMVERHDITTNFDRRLRAYGLASTPS